MEGALNSREGIAPLSDEVETKIREYISHHLGASDVNLEKKETPEGEEGVWKITQSPMQPELVGTTFTWKRQEDGSHMVTMNIPDSEEGSQSIAEFVPGTGWNKEHVSQ